MQCIAGIDEPCAGFVLGSYTVNIYNNGNGTATFVVEDPKTRTSAERHPLTGKCPPAVTREQSKPGEERNWRPFGIDVTHLGITPGPEGWGGNMYSRFVWTELIQCEECR
jgi:hypothetical protein